MSITAQAYALIADVKISETHLQSIVHINTDSSILSDAIRQQVMSELKELYKDDIKSIDDPRILQDMKHKHGVYVCVNAKNNKYEVYLVEDKQTSGWISSGTVRSINSIGHFTLISIKNLDIITQFITKTNSFLKKERENYAQLTSYLEAVVDESNSHITTLTELLDREREKQLLISEHQTIVSLNRQIIELRQKLEEIKKTNIKRARSNLSNIHQLRESFDTCIGSIVSFDKTKLLSYEARSELLERKK